MTGRIRALEVYDINCDGELDLLLTAEGDNEINILLGDAGLSFAPAQSFPIDGSVPTTIARHRRCGRRWPNCLEGTVDFLEVAQARATFGRPPKRCVINGGLRPPAKTNQFGRPPMTNTLDARQSFLAPF